MKQPVWAARDVVAHKDYTLVITFADGQRRVFDARPLLSLDMYAPLRSLPFFLRAKAACGTVVWDDEVDVAPEYLYECSRPLN